MEHCYLCVYLLNEYVYMSFHQHKEDIMLRYKTINAFIKTNILISKIRARLSRTTVTPVSSQSISLVGWEKINSEI